MNSVMQEIRRKNFDSTLLNTPLLLGGNDPNTCFDLIIYLKVHLRQLNPPRGRADFSVRDYDTNRVLCSRWTDGDARPLLTFTNNKLMSSGMRLSA